MQKIMNFFLGSVLVEVHSSYPERFFNLCARKGIEFWDMSICDIGIFRLRMTPSNFRKLPSVARKAGCSVHIIEKRGYPFFINRFRKRAVLVCGCVVFCLIAWVFTNFVWIMEIDGFQGLDAAKLRRELEISGLHIGAYAKNINLEELRNDILIKMPELSYVSVNFNGSHALVTAKKRTNPPQILPENTPCDIVADKDGIIYDITVKSGTPQVLRGETVLKGQILASGYITGRAGSTVLTHADAHISAKTWRRESARMQKKYDKKIYTGREKKLSTIILLNKRIKLYINSGISYTKCDKIIKRTDLEIFGGIRLPISLEYAIYREYEIQSDVISDAAAFDCLGEELHKALDIPEEIEVVDVDFRTSSDEKFAYASITAECIEEIGEKRAILKDG